MGTSTLTAAGEALLDGLDEIVAMVVPANDRSQGVMRKLGMTRDETADFDHPLVPEGSPVRRHRLYRLHRGEWESPSSR